MSDTDLIEVNPPFQRVPMCSCDPGHGPAPTILKMLECKIAGGPCHPDYVKLHPQAAEPAQPE